MKSYICSGGLEGGYVSVETSVFKCLDLTKINRCLKLLRSCTLCILLLIDYTYRTTVSHTFVRSLCMLSRIRTPGGTANQ